MMSACKLKRPPVFFIGMPRSGTTIVFEKFVESLGFGWLSNYSEMYPSFPFINLLCPLLKNRLIDLSGHKKQYGKVRFGNRYMPQAVEAYAFWDRYARHDFSSDFLLEDIATPEEQVRVCKAINKTLMFQGKNRFATKLTGPGRIIYIKSIFPDARFIHVVRDGRAVVGSLMKVDFWKDKGGFERPFWENGLSEDDLSAWYETQHPAVLTAIEWVKVVNGIRNDSINLAEDQYTEIRYEDFVQLPEDHIEKLYDFVGHREVITQTAATDSNMIDRNRTNLTDIDSHVITIIEMIMKDALMDYGYAIE
ncbi:MAG: sulfotransferase [Methylococcales bacterium]